MRHGIPKRVRELGEAVARKDTVAHAESTVDPRSEARGAHLREETLAVELRMRDEAVSVASVHPGLRKTVLETRMETQVHQVVFGAQRANSACRERALEKPSGVDTEIVVTRCEASVELEKNTGVSMAKTGRVIGCVVCSKP
jgi:hypothetical protein